MQIILRADSGFCREKLMQWCEQEPGLDYVFGFARNRKLRALIEEPMIEVDWQQSRIGQPARLFTAFEYQTSKTWSRARRTVAKTALAYSQNQP